MRKKVVLLGASGSIGTSTLKVLRQLPDRFELFGMAVGENSERLANLGREFHCTRLVVANPQKQDDLQRAAAPGTICTSGAEAICELVAHDEVDIVVCAIVGTGGLLPVLTALRHGKRVALASKEISVMAGEILNRELDAGHGSIVPVDSEHSAIFQCLSGRKRAEVRNLILTASGGAFRDTTTERMRRATYAEALRHPTWSMGPKVTVDSATLMNKALEILEAGTLFRVSADQIKVVIHPQSLVHSMIELVDHSILAQIALPDMRFAIQYALTYPERCDGALPEFPWDDLQRMDFYPPDRKRFPSLDFAYETLRTMGTLPAVLNAANEVAVQRFQRNEFSLPGIYTIVEKTLEAHRVLPQENLDVILEADRWAREFASNVTVNSPIG